MRVVNSFLILILHFDEIHNAYMVVHIKELCTYTNHLKTDVC